MQPVMPSPAPSTDDGDSDGAGKNRGGLQVREIGARAEHVTPVTRAVTTIVQEGPAAMLRYYAASRLTISMTVFLESPRLRPIRR